MADSREIVITIRGEGSASTVDLSEEESRATAGDVGGSRSDTSKSAIFKFAALRMGSAAIQEGLAWAEYYLNRELILNDDYIGQRGMQHAMQGINKTISYGKSMIAGAITGGLKFGPIGAFVGAALGLGTSIASTARENAQAMDQQNILLRQMNAQLNYTRQRAGWSLEAASIGEDL